MSKESEIRMTCRDLLKNRYAGYDPHGLAKAWLAEHPEDDAEPITEEWFRSVNAGDFQAFAGNPPISVFIDIDGTIMLHIEPEESAGAVTYSIPLPHIKTRGQIRQLCSALCVPLKENR